MATLSVPRNEFYELVNNIDETLFKAISRIKPDEINELTLKPKFEERVNQYFEEFTNRYPTENVSESRKVSMDEIPAYISSAKEITKYKRKWRKIRAGCAVVMGGGIGCFGAAVFNPVMLWIGTPAFVGGFVGTVAMGDGKDPLTVYREQYRNQIIDAYGR